MERKILCEISCLLLVLYNSLIYYSFANIPIKKPLKPPPPLLPQTSSTEVSNDAHDIFVQPSMYYAYQYEIK